MASKYRVDIDESDGLTISPIGEVTGAIPDDVQHFILRCEQFADRIRRQVDKGPGGTAYIIKHLLPSARVGLQDGDLNDGNNGLEILEQDDFTAKYYQMEMDPRKVFEGRLHPWIPLPLPKEATALMNRISRTFSKVNNLLEPNHKPESKIQVKSK